MTNRNVLAAVSAICVLGAVTVPTAGPAMAAKGDPVAGGAQSTWEMPDVKGMILHPALQSILSATGGKHVKIHYVDAGRQTVYNDENWMVCGQAPAPGAQTARYSVTLKVERPAFDECPSS